MDYEIWSKDLKYQIFWRRLIDVITENELTYRFKLIENDKVSQWDWLIEPVDCCIESGYYGPAAKWEVEWIEVDPIVEEKKDANLPSEWVDCTNYLCEKLTEAGIEYEIINHFIRIKTTS